MLLTLIKYMNMMIYQFGFIDTGTFPDTWKIGNIIPAHKKGDKHIVNNYSPVSLLPIFGKSLEKLL